MRKESKQFARVEGCQLLRSEGSWSQCTGLVNTNSLLGMDDPRNSTNTVRKERGEGMSDRWASSCRGKKHYNSERRADEAAKASQVVYGVPMRSYKCDFCGRWHVGNTFACNGKKARM